MNNALVVTLPSAQASGAFGAFTSHRYYDMTGDSISVEVVNAGNTTTTERAFFGLGNDDSTHPHVSFEQQAGSLGVFMSTGNGSYSILSASTYDPLKHRYWRIRNTGGTTYFETSPDANTWSIFWQGSIATVFPTNIAKIELGGATNGGELNPSPIQFAKLNGGGPPTGMWCPISSITDDFQSTTRSPIWARSWTGVSETVTQGNGTLTFTLAPNVATGAMYESYQSYDLTSNAVLVHVPMVPNTTATHAEIRLGLVAQGSNEIQIGEASGYMIFRYIKAGTYSDTSQPYDAVAHAWWRIRESGGTIYWETAPDGKTWSGRRVVTLTTLGFPITGMDVELSGDTYSPDANPGTCSCSAFNLPPP